MCLEQTTILHVVETHTGYQNEKVLRGRSAHDLRLVFAESWATLYLRYRNQIRLDQGANFKAKYLRDLAIAQGLELQFSRV